MLKGLIGKVVGDPNEREVRKLSPLVEAINALELELERRTDAELRSLTDRFRLRLASGETLDELLVEVFAAAREAAKRKVDMRPFDVQLIGGIVLHQGKVAEMKTGEGKTLVATMPICLNALTGRGVHLVTVNDYLARRDTLWMGPIYDVLGLSVGLLQSGAEQPAYLYDPTYQREPYPGLRPVPRQQAYGADVTYGTNNEFGFDYLRDNLALSLERRVQRPLYYAIVDEVDNIFIDEARTPLIISGPSDESVEDYSRFAVIARKLQPNVHYELDEKERTVFLTDEGLAAVEEETGIENIYDEANYRYVHYMQQALKAQVLFQEGRDYIRQRKQIILVDPHTGRLMPNRRLSEGLHQAIEAKEAVPVRPRDVTSATITIQNYFRMYEKLAGMSGTAVTEGEEFFKIYHLDVAVIPTNKPAIRQDYADVVYRSEEAKLRAVAREILTCHAQGQPVLVGTTSVEMSERLSRRLTGERLQMAALSPRAAYALQDAALDRDERSGLRETMNATLETMNSAAWRKMMRTLDLEPNALSGDNPSWICQYLELTDEGAAWPILEQAFRDGIPHNVLNAKEHTREALIIARAGEPGAVTIATNMAGRGVDIKLGGELSDEDIHKTHLALAARGLDPYEATAAQMDSAVAEVMPQYAKRREQVLAAGGLHILGTERHEARRIDNQLRGRSGRQGEPGSSRFYLSLEDDLMRRFGRKEMLSKLMEQIGEDFPIEHSLVTKTIERAQTSVEGYNFDIRKHLLEYDDVLNRQRETIYDDRVRILRSDDLHADVWRMLEGQVDEYLEKYGADPEQQRLVFDALDGIAPLMLQSSNDPFPGPLAFAGSVTAFPPFTISLLADQFADHPSAEVEEALDDLADHAASGYGIQIRQMVGETARAILDKYDERLDRYRALLDEKIDDYDQLAEERGLPADPRRLAQHLERTYPFKLTTPRDSFQAEVDDLREHWLAEIEAEFHRQTCNAIMDRTQVRLPPDVRLDRLQPARISAAKLADEMQRVFELAAKQPRDDDARRQLGQFTLPTNPDAAQVLAFVETIKETSRLDFARLDRLVGHILGAYLDDLLGQYLKALDEEQGRLSRDLERLRATVVEGQKGARPNNLLGVLRELNGLVHLDTSVLEDLLSQAVAHEYDKWSQYQLAEMQAGAVRNHLRDSQWSTVAEHLLATYYVQRQVYDRAHRRRATWMPRLPLSFVAQAHTEGLERDTLRNTLLTSLQWIVEQREQTWGKQELQRWGHLTLDELDSEAYDSFLRFLGEQELGDVRQQPVEELPPDLYDRLRFILMVRQWEDKNLRLGDLPQAEALQRHLGQAVEKQILDTPLGQLDAEVRQRIQEHLSQAGLLDDAAARSSFLQQQIGDWDQRTRDQVASFVGQQFLENHKGQRLAELAPEPRRVAVSYLQRQHRFVDEERVQQFLIHQRLSDLPPETKSPALTYLARTRLDRVSKRKISNLDVNTREVVTGSLQRMGLFSDDSHRDQLLSRSLNDLGLEVKGGFGMYLARHEMARQSMARQSMDHRTVGDLETGIRTRVLARLKGSNALAHSARATEFAALRLDDLDETVAAGVRDEMERHLQADLATKAMEELPAETRRQIHHALDEQDYFIDHDKVGRYERKTLAQLPTNILRGLEQHLGQVRLGELSTVPFRDLSAETQENLLTFLQSAGLFSDRAERLRLTQAGSLAELPAETRGQLIQHLGRQWSVQIRDRRPPDLPQPDREAVWVYLRDQGYFADEFKEELFAYQRLDEFGNETQRAVETALVDQLTATLRSQRIGDMPPDLQASIRTRLTQTDYFVDQDRLRQAAESPVTDLPPDLRRAVEAAVGEELIAGLDTVPVAELPSETQTALWRYLDGTGYFVDGKKRTQILDRRLADLRSEVYEIAVTDLADYLKAEIGDKAVSELDDELRQGLREALEALGYFENKGVQVQVLAQPLGSLRREDLETLATEFGKTQLEAWSRDRLIDLPETDREAVLANLTALDWFLDRSRLEKLQAQPLRSLEGGVQSDLVDRLCSQQTERLLQQRLSTLDRSQRYTVHRLLREQEAALEEGQIRPLRRQNLGALDAAIYEDLLSDLGAQAVAGWGSTRFQQLDQEQQAFLSAYLGRRIMGRLERQVLLYTISRLWIDYLTDIEDLRRGIGLEAYGQRDPLVEYKRRAFELFAELQQNISSTTIHTLFRQPPAPLRAQ